MTETEMYKLISNNLKYGAYVYNQINLLPSEWNGNYTIEYLYDSIPNNSLLFMVPVYSSIEGTNSLTLRYLVRTEKVGDVIKGIYQSKNFTIYVENPEGILTKATKGDIIAHRLCIFRFIKGDDDTVILVNSPSYNSVSYNNISVTGEAKFYNTPVVVDKSTGSKIPLATKTDFISLENRVATLERKFIYGSIEAEEALIDAEPGTIYIKVEEGQ